MLNSTSTHLQDFVGSIPSLTQPPEGMARLLCVVLDDSCTAIDLAHEIDGNPGLSSRILRLVNSSCYGLDWSVSTIPDAAVTLGFDEVERIALAVAVVDMFSRDRASVKALRLLWRHSLACSIAAGVIEQHNRHRYPPMQGAHIAAMLHDVGKAVLALHYPQDVWRMNRLVSSGADACEAEQTVFGTTHCDLGGWLAEAWGLPDAIVRSIVLHHALDDTVEHEPMPHAVHVANCIVKNLGIGSGNSREGEILNTTSCELVGLDDVLMTLVLATLRRSHCLINAVTSGAMYANSFSET